MEIREIKCQLRADLKTGVLPGPLLKVPEIRQDLAAAFSLSEQVRPGRPELADILSRTVEDETLARLLAAQESKPSLVLRDGIFRSAGRPGAFAIEDLTLSADSLYVRALAETDICQQILTETAAIVKKHTNALADLDAAIDNYAYATETRVKLDFSIEDLLSPELRTFVLDTLPAAVPKKTTERVVVHPFNIDFKVRLLSTDEPLGEPGNFRITHEEFKDHDALIYVVYSRFPSATHYHLLEELNRMLSARLVDGPISEAR